MWIVFRQNYINFTHFYFNYTPTYASALWHVKTEKYEVRISYWVRPKMKYHRVILFVIYEFSECNAPSMSTYSIQPHE